MKRVTLLVVALALVAGAAAPHAVAAKKKKAQPAVSGTINGKGFTATNKSGVNDPCMNGIYRPADEIVVFTALECKPKRRRQGVAVKKHYKLLFVTCLPADAGAEPRTPPFELVCPFSNYTENRTGRFGVPISTTMWGASYSYDGFATGSNLRMRVDAFDGTTLRGVLFGSFDEPISGPGSEVPAPISGEMPFAFPIQVD